MKALISAVFFAMISSAFASPFSPEEILGTYNSTDRMAQVKVYKKLVKEATLFEPATYEYLADITFDAGPCMEMYGGEREVTVKNQSFNYNGSWLPKTEYLSTSYRGDNDYDGSVYVDSISLRATKYHDNGKSKIRLDLDFNLIHNPDYSDGEDGGEASFDECMEKTVSGWVF
jgi:hypothetical protein